MNSKKVLTLVFYVVFIVAAGYLFLLSKNNHHLLAQASSFDRVVDEFNNQQKDTAIANIVSFSLLLIIGLWIFKVLRKANYILLSFILYIAVTLFNFMSLNKQLFALKGGVPSDYGAYWLMTFIGVFYIIGAVGVAAIGYITVKNYTKRRGE